MNRFSIIHSLNQQKIQEIGERVLSKHIAESEQNVKPWTPAIQQQYARVSLDDLLFRDEFLNINKNVLYPLVLDTLYEAWELWIKEELDYVVILASIGSGKTSLNAIMQWLMWYRLTTQYYDYREEFDMLKDQTRACLVQISDKEEHAREVTFNKVAPLFKNTRFNKDYFPVDSKIKSRLVINRNNTLIFPGAGLPASVLGYDIYGGCLDEMTAMRVVKKSARGEGSNIYDPSFKIWSETERRAESRIGRKKGLIVMISQRRTGNEFIEKFAREAENGIRKRCLVKKYTFWDAVGIDNPKFFNQPVKYFYFNAKNFRIIDDPEQVKQIDKRKGIIDGNN